MNTKKGICLIISDENPTQQPRIRNFVFAMSTKFDFKFVTPSELDDWPHTVLNRPFIWNRHHHLHPVLRKPLSFILRIFHFVRRRSAHIDVFFRELELQWSNPRQNLGAIDLVFCTHPWMAPLGRKYARASCARLICDLFEYYPGQFPDDIQPLHAKERVKRELIRASGYVDRFIVASEKFIPEYQRFLNAEFTYFPCAAPFHSTNFCRHTTPSTKKRRLVHHGTANPSRRIENMIHSIGRGSPNNECDFFLIFPKAYPDYEEHIHKIANQYSNVKIRKPVPPNRLIETLSKYDVGFYILPPLSMNQELLLPNKIFDFIQARIFAVIGPSYGFRHLVLDYNIGLVAENFSNEAVDITLNALNDVDWQEARSNLERAAEELSLEKMSADLENDINRLMED